MDKRNPDLMEDGSGDVVGINQQAGAKPHRDHVRYPPHPSFRRENAEALSAHLNTERVPKQPDQREEGGKVDNRGERIVLREPFVRNRPLKVHDQRREGEFSAQQYWMSNSVVLLSGMVSPKGCGLRRLLTIAQLRSLPE